MVKTMERWEGKVAVVTGASSGIGAAIATALVKKGLKVIGLARRVDRIEDLACNLANESGQLFAVSCDVSNESSILEAFQWVIDNVGPVHVLVNNAGLTNDNNLIEGDTEKWRQVLDVNVLGLCICTREALKSMKENGIDGHIIHINSVSGHYVPFMGGPLLNVYSASKFAVTSLTETLRQDLRFEGSKIKVTSLSPGMVSTELVSGLGEEAKQAVQSVPTLNPDDVAEGIIYVLSTGPSVQVTELTIRPVGEAF